MPDERPWYEVEEKERTPAQREQRWICYYQSLFSNPHGRAMVCDLKRRIEERIQGCAKTPELAVAQIWLETFFEDTLTLAGVTDYTKLVDSMVPIARSWKPPVEPKPYLPPGYTNEPQEKV